MLYACGGSTNCVMHLLAIAYEARLATYYLLLLTTYYYYQLTHYYYYYLLLMTRYFTHLPPAASRARGRHPRTR